MTWTNISLQKSRRQNSTVFRLDGKKICKVTFLNTLQELTVLCEQLLINKRMTTKRMTVEGKQEELTLKRYYDHLKTISKNFQ